MRAARGLTGSLFVSNKPADLKEAINPLKKRRRRPGPRLIRITLVPIRAGRDLIVQAGLCWNDERGRSQKWQTGYRDSNRAFLPHAVIPAKAGIHAYRT